MPDASTAITLDDHVKAIVAAALAAERRRTSEILFELAQRRRDSRGIGDPLVADFAYLATVILDPAK